MLDVAVVYDAHAHEVFHYLRRRLIGVDDVVIEDLASDVWERAYRARDRYHDEGKLPRHWILRIARNRLIDYLRAHRVVDSFDEMLGSGAEPSVTYEIAEDVARRQMIGSALHRLTGAQRAVIEARYLIGANVAETARSVGRTEDGVKKLQARALMNLRQHITEAA